jgi:hypothetical protein
VRLNGKESLLVLRSPAHDANSIDIVPSLTDALPAWNGRDRLAPIFEVDIPQSGTSFHFRKRANGSLFFIGPVNPATADGCLRILKGTCDRAWLCYGLFNLVIYASSHVTSQSVVLWAKRHGIRWERWKLTGNRVGRVSQGNSSYEKPSDLLRSLADFHFKMPTPELRDAAEEYCALLAAAACRSKESYPEITDELQQASSIITQSALQSASESHTGAGIPAITLLVDTNAALSRFTSQTFSGIPPIRETECHFWTHSLLGTGIANLAVLKIRRFITRTLGEARLPDQVKLLEQIDDEQLVREVLEDGALWEGPFLQKLPELLKRKPLLQELAPIAPLITYLSGRDGFHTTQISLSAPLNILTSCSSLRWSLLTITHEMSHRVVDEVLSYILPDPGDISELSEAACLLNETKRPANLLDALRFKVLNTMAELNAVAPLVKFPDDVKSQDVVALMGSRREEVEEVMVHVFDFLYFYGADPEIYVPSIWKSWDAIPSLHRRLPG